MLRKEEWLKRHPENPVIKPSDYPGVDAVMNCSQTMYGDDTVLLVSVICKHAAVETRVARSSDGIRFEMEDHAFIRSDRPPFDAYTRFVIDTRMTRIGDTFYIVHPHSSGRMSPCGVMGKTMDFKTYEPLEIVALPQNRVPCLFPEKIHGDYVRLDRPGGGPDTRATIWISYSPDLIHWGRHRPLLETAGRWGSLKIGPTPPVRTEEGWLEIFHGVRQPCSGNVYSIGAMLLDLEDPSRIIGRMSSYLLTPDAPYEHHGRTSNVVFPCGVIADHAQDVLRLYYGAADTCIGLASGCLSEIVDACIKEL